MLFCHCELRLSSLTHKLSFITMIFSLNHPDCQIVTFVFDKQVLGATRLAKVKHTQYCRVEGKDKCVLAMTVEMTGVPYSDCFNVEIRWVATRSGRSLYEE